MSSHANMSAAVKDAVTPALLREVRDFWFEHLTNPKALIMPSFEDNKRWFFGGAALEEACTYVPRARLYVGRMRVTAHHVCL